MQLLQTWACPVTSCGVLLRQTRKPIMTKWRVWRKSPLQLKWGLSMSVTHVLVLQPHRWDRRFYMKTICALKR